MESWVCLVAVPGPSPAPLNTSTARQHVKNGTRRHLTLLDSIVTESRTADASCHSIVPSPHCFLSVFLALYPGTPSKSVVKNLQPHCRGLREWSLEIRDPSEGIGSRDDDAIVHILRWSFTDF